MNRRLLIVFAILTVSSPTRADGPTRVPIARSVDLDLGETQRVTLSDGSSATVTLLDLNEERDTIRQAIRQARVKILVNDQPITIDAGQYHLPQPVAGVQVDCPVTGGYRANTTEDHWGLVKAARLRLWPGGSPWIEPGAFGYPLRQRWFASLTQMANEPVFVDGGEDRDVKKIYYHSGLDIGGAEGLAEVVAATDGRVVSSGTERLTGFDDSPIAPRYDVVYLLDDRGWYYRYSHLRTIDSSIKPGATVAKAQRLGLLGKEGGSGGWSHLHFEIVARQPSGRWGTEEGYAFLWQANLRENHPELIAVARPHVFATVGTTVVLDGSRSWSRSGPVARYDWAFDDGSTATGATAERVYKKPGTYSEILKITDRDGRIEYDFAAVQVLDPVHPELLPPTIHASFFPTVGIQSGAAVTFKVRSFRIGPTEGRETWDFGDGSPTVTVQSDGNAVQHAEDGYAVTTHRFDRPGHYLARVERTNRHGIRATARLHVIVGGSREK
jgi:murein DD-endopeptidase MepM/ murein hydrolase activator NlpD